MKKEIEKLIKGLHHYSMDCSYAQEDDDYRIKEYLKQLDYVVNNVINLIDKQKAEIRQIVLEDVPHQYQDRLLDKLK